MDFLASKPVEIDELPTQLCITTDSPIEDPMAKLFRSGKNKTEVLAELTPRRVEGCKYTFLLTEALASCITTGRHVLDLFSGCDYCTCVELEFTSRCALIDVTVENHYVDTDGCC